MRTMHALWRPQVALVAGTAALASAAYGVSRSPVGGYALPLFVLGAALAFVGSAVYVAWNTAPAVLISAGIVLSPFASNWEQIGIPGAVAPDRLLLVAAVAVVVLRSPRVRDRVPIQWSPVHVVLAATLLYAAVSAAASGTLLANSGFFRLFDMLGILPYAIFLVAPVAFSTPRDRDVLLRAIVLLAAYLGLTAVFETTGLDALVWPKYILDPNYGYHAGRGRGPFVEAVTNGFGLYTCAVGCAVAATLWKSRWRWLAGAVGLLCLISTAFTLERSVWLGAIVATTVVMLATRGLRTWFVPLLAVVALAVALSVLLIPGMRNDINDRLANRGTVWGRQNMDSAAVNMVMARPLVGFGWNRSAALLGEYMKLSPDRPLSGAGQRVHNLFLGYAADLGLVGLTLWVLGPLVALATVARRRGPPEVRVWKAALAAVAIMFAVVVSFVPPTFFPNLAFWLWAGVVWGCVRRPGEPARHEIGDPLIRR